jgi:hypothetical protein
MIAAAKVLMLIGENGSDPIFAYRNHSNAPATRAEGGTCFAP